MVNNYKDFINYLFKFKDENYKKFNEKLFKENINSIGIRMNTLKEELEDMSNIVKEEYLDKSVADDEIIKIKDRLKDLENQIVRIVENK